MPAHPPAPVGQHRTGTSFLRVLGAAGIVMALHLVLILVVNGPPPSDDVLPRVLGRLTVPAVLATLVIWLSVRRRELRYWVLVLLVLAAYLVVSVVANAGAAAGR
jgi:Ca2+/Na+ antiporter